MKILFIGAGRGGPSGFSPGGFIWIDSDDVESVGINLVTHEGRHSVQRHYANLAARPGGGTTTGNRGVGNRGAKCARVVQPTRDAG